MPDIQQTGILLLLKSALINEKCKLSENFDFSKGIKTAKKHNVSAMLYYGAVISEVSCNTNALQELFNITALSMSVSENQTFELERIFSAFEEKGIDYLPIKGTVLKKLYPKPEMRVMGDADILINPEQYDVICSTMASLGFEKGTESDHEIKWQSHSLYLEFHNRIISPKSRDYFEYWKNPWEKAINVSGHRYKFSDEDDFIYILTHLAIHYRAGGIGIKHFTDIFVYLRSKPELDFEYIERELKKIRLYDFFCNIKKLLSVWFGEEPGDAVTDYMTEYIFSSGCFGTYERNALASAVKSKQKLGSSKKARIREIKNVIFLPYKGMCAKYPILKKMPFLLPFMWIIRIFTVLLLKRKRLEALDVRINTVTEKNIDDYHLSLRLVGLDFNFKE